MRSASGCITEASQMPRKKTSKKEPLFLYFAKLADKDGVAPIHNHKGCWERQVGDWWFAINPHTRTTKCSKGADVEFGHAYVMYNGWPAGILNPFGGVIAAGSVANEETFIAALEKELAA